MSGGGWEDITAGAIHLLERWQLIRHTVSAGLTRTADASGHMVFQNYAIRLVT